MNKQDKYTITHKDAKRMHQELKHWLNKFPIDPEHYAKEMNVIYDYIKQQELKDLQADIELTHEYMSNGETDFIILNWSYDENKAFEIGKAELHDMRQYDTYEIVVGYATYGYYTHWETEEDTLGWHTAHNPEHYHTGDQIQVWVVRGEYTNG